MAGTGYVGLTTGTCFAEIGHEVICCDIDKEKIDLLNKGEIPIFEPGLKELVKKNVNAARLSFTTDLKQAVRDSDVIFIAVGTPPKHNGEADLSYVENVAKDIGAAMNGYKLIVEKSTVPVETGKWIKKTIQAHNIHGFEFDVASNPEFLREGSAIKDFLEPDRIVIGVENEKAEKILKEIYEPINAPMIVTDLNSAEIIKHAANSFLSMKISFINAIANVCELAGADVKMVAKGIGHDKRIGRHFLDAGIGYGGYCFPKDLQAFVNISNKLGYDFKLLKEVESINENQRKMFVEKIRNTLWNLKEKEIGVLGLSFKPNTDDIREAPSIQIINELQKDGAKIKAYCPGGMENAKKILKDIKLCSNAYEVCENSYALLIITEWEDFANLDFDKVKHLMKRPLIIDGRNMFEPKVLKSLGFEYECIGR